jgi:hypothetical protein
VLTTAEQFRVVTVNRPRELNLCEHVVSCRNYFRRTVNGTGLIGCPDPDWRCVESKL